MLLKSEYIRLTPNERIYGLQVPVIGLTGGISSGKSFVANYLESKGIKVICADKMIKEIYQKKCHQGLYQIPCATSYQFRRKHQFQTSKRVSF